MKYIHIIGGTQSLEDTNQIYNNIELLKIINLEIKENIYELNEENKNYIIRLYRTFYYPKHPLTKLEEINSHHQHLKKILKKI